tara:strand:- start:1684 stop:2688 length:1005 start_codon:yes stop_codon:yes gene_type:complete
MIIKSFLIEKDISIADKYSSVLFYGENIGMKDEIKSEIKKYYKGFEEVTLNQDEIIRNEKLLYEQIHNTSLFTKNKLIFINGISDKIKNNIIEVTEEPKDDLKIFFFSENLEKKSKIRDHFEKGKNIAAVPCYQDNERTLSEYLRKKFKDYSGLNQEIINILIKNSGLDRKVLNNEVDKIKNLFLDKKIKNEKLVELINYEYNLDFNNLRDSCFGADKNTLNKDLGNVVLKSEDTYFYLNSLNSRIEKLFHLNIQCQKDKNIEAALDNIKPKIFWKDKPIFYKQIQKWNLKKLKDARKTLIDTEILIKTRLNTYNNTIIKDLLVKLCKKAASTS